ncbi:MAG: 30S ribosomal protein S9 [Nanoarchaeota archaeon]
MKPIIHASGKRKRAIARATLREGTGIVKINKKFLDYWEPEMYRLKIQEPLILSGEIGEKVNIDVNVHGGGLSSMAGAARLAISRCLVQHSPRLKEQFLGYDRQLLIADVRRKESAKPNSHGQARSKLQKSYR